MHIAQLNVTAEKLVFWQVFEIWLKIFYLIFFNNLQDVECKGNCPCKKILKDKLYNGIVLENDNTGPKMRCATCKMRCNVIKSLKFINVKNP